MDFAEIISGIGENFVLRKGNSIKPSYAGLPPIEDEDQIGENEFYLYVASLDQYVDEEITADGEQVIIKIPPPDQYNLFWCVGGVVKLIDNLKDAIDNYDTSTKLVERLEALKYKDLDPTNETEDKYIYDIIVKSLDGMSKDDFVPNTRTVNDHQLNEDINIPLSDIPDDIGMILGLVKESDGNELPVNTDKKVVLPTTMTENIIPDLVIEENGDIFISWTPTEFDSLFASAEQGQMANTAIQGANLNGNPISIVNKILQLNNIATSSDITTINNMLGAFDGAKINSGSISTDKLANNSVTNGKIADNAINSSKIADGSIVNADISSSANISASKISGINDVAVTGTRSGNTLNIRLPGGNYLKMAWGYVGQSSGPSTVTIPFPSGFFTATPHFYVGMAGIPTYDNGYRIRTAYINSDATNPLTKDQAKVFAMALNVNKSTGNTAVSTSATGLRWLAIGY